jgi:hypothetical protein
MTVEFALNLWCDPKLCSSQNMIHLLGKMCCKLWLLNDQQGFVFGLRG